MNQYTNQSHQRNSDVALVSTQNINRFARRLNRQFGISLHHALAVAEANGVGKEQCDG